MKTSKKPNRAARRLAKKQRRTRTNKKTGVVTVVTDRAECLEVLVRIKTNSMLAHNGRRKTKLSALTKSAGIVRAEYRIARKDKFIVLSGERVLQTFSSGKAAHKALEFYRNCGQTDLILRRIY